MSIADTRIGIRMGFGFGLLLFMMTVVLLVALIRFSNIGSINDRIIDQEWVKAEAANTINATIRTNARRTMELLIAADDAESAKIYEHIGANKKIIDDALVTLDKLIYIPEARALLGQVKEVRARYVASFTEVGKMLKEGRRDEAVVLLKKVTLPTLDALQREVIRLSDMHKLRVQASSAEIHGDISSGRKLMLGLGAFAGLLGAALALWITRSITRPLNHAVRIAQTVASGNLTSEITVSSKDETGELLLALKHMNSSLISIVAEVRSGTDTIATASGQIAAGNLDLSARTEQQASSLQETASSMEELTSTVGQNADNARQANSLAGTASSAASQGGAVMAQVVRTMGEINEAAKRIVDIISVIDGIAFQTNILALNAAVEAARAGEQGRGFAVVAAEVRSLAQRSASAAKEIKNLISDSVDKIDAGTRLVDQAGATMQDVVGSVQRVSDIITEITAASVEQSAGIGQINKAIGEMDTVTQQNASLVEQAAAAAQALQDQADSLARVVGMFKTEGRTEGRVVPMPMHTTHAHSIAAVRPVPARVANGAAVQDAWEEF